MEFTYKSKLLAFQKAVHKQERNGYYFHIHKIFREAKEGDKFTLV